MITTQDLRVDYDGLTAVSDLTLSIDSGEVFGLIGPNGAGKTSTIRVLATLLEPTYGDVHVGGFDIAQQPGEVHKILGYMPDNPPVYDDVRCWEFLDLFARAYFVSRRERKRQVEKCLDDVDLTAKRDVMAGTLSTGMRQRLVLAKTLLPDPQILLLDEPASGLDPIARIELRELLKQQGEMGKTVLVSSHILTELSGFCSSIGIMEKGKLLVSGRIDEIVDSLNAHKRIILELSEVSPATKQFLEDHDCISILKDEEVRIVCDFSGTDHDTVELLRTMVRKELPIMGFYEKRMDIEDILLQVGAKEVS